MCTAKKIGTAHTKQAGIGNMIWFEKRKWLLTWVRISLLASSKYGIKERERETPRRRNRLLDEKGGYEFSFPQLHRRCRPRILWWNLTARPGGCHPDTEVQCPTVSFEFLRVGLLLGSDHPTQLGILKTGSLPASCVGPTLPPAWMLLSISISALAVV